MSIRPVQRIIESQPTMEGAGVHLRRAFGFGETEAFDPFLLLDDFAMRFPRITSLGFHGTRTGGLRRSPMFWREP